jgi:hypothetical protein
MSSNWKRLFLLLSASAAILTFAGCDRFLKSSKSEQERAEAETVTLKPAGLGCLVDFPTKLENYVKDKASAGEVEEAFACLEKSLQTFVKLTSGTRPDSYTDEELRHFLNRYLLKGNQISPAFMRELMKIKALVVGGSTSLISRAEIDQGIRFTKSVKDEALQLRGKMRFLLFEAEREKVDEALLAETQEQLIKSVSRLLEQSKVAGTLYEFADFKGFIDELRGFLNDTESLRPFLKWMPLLESVKVLFLGTRSQVASQRDWQQSLTWSIQGYFAGLEFHYRLRHRDLDTPADWSRLLRLADKVMDLVERSPVLEDNGRLQTAALDRVFDEVWKLKLINTDISVKTVKSSYRMAILRILERNGSRQAQPSEALGLDRKHLSVLRFEYNVWRMTQEMVLALFQDRDLQKGVTPEDVHRAVDGFDAGAAIGRLKNGEADRELLAETWKDWSRLMKQDRPIQWTAGPKMLMRYNTRFATTDFVGMNWSNAIRSLARLVQRGYGEGPSKHVSDLQISERSLMNFEEDFREIGQAIRFLDPRSHNPAGRTFKEANFFTFHGDGNDWMSGLETYEELSFLVSGGSGLTEDVMRLAKEAGCENGKIDILGKPMLNEVCFEKFLRGQFSKIFNGLPWMAAEVAQMSDREWKNFYDSMISVAALDKRSPGAVEFSEIRTAVVVIQYVEGLMMSFDTDQNNKLSEEEITKAAPRFRSFIQKLSPLGGFLVDDIFLCLVYEGKKPGLSDLTAFEIEKVFGLGDIGRQELLKVLSVLKKDVAK